MHVQFYQILFVFDHLAVIVTLFMLKPLKGFGGIAIGGIVGLDIYFLAFISYASMNPACS